MKNNATMPLSSAADMTSQATESPPNPAALQADLRFYIPTLDSTITQDQLPFSALSHAQQRLELMRYLRTLKA